VRLLYSWAVGETGFSHPKINITEGRNEMEQFPPFFKNGN
jgi:hypothetical protein